MYSVNVNQHKICQLMLYNLSMFDDIHHFGFASFSENAQEARGGTHLSCNLEDRQRTVHQKNSMCTQILGYAKNTCLAPGLKKIKNTKEEIKQQLKNH